MCCDTWQQEMAGSEDGHQDEDANSAASLEDGEYDKYLAELSHSGGGSDGGSDAGETLLDDLAAVHALHRCQPRRISLSGGSGSGIAASSRGRQ